ncbi:MAG: cell division protein FtsZ, partial [Sphingomonadaceae bacterium]
LFLVAKADTTFKEAFLLADEVLQQGVRSITDLMVMPGLINLDFADVRSVMGEMGKAMMGTGEASGDNRAIEAAEKAISNPLLDGVSMKGAKGVIISIVGGEDMKLMEVDEAASHIKELVDDDANIIWGSAFNQDMEGQIRVSVVATGIDGEEAAMHKPAATTTAASQPGKVFTFPTPKTAPAGIDDTPTQVSVPETANEEEEILDLTAEDEADELVLDNEDVLTPPVSKPPFIAPEADDLPDEVDAEGGVTAEEPAAGAASGGTLFERMSNIAKGADETESGATDGPGFRREPIDIPSFLNRQNNQ